MIDDKLVEKPVETNETISLLMFEQKNLDHSMIVELQRNLDKLREVKQDLEAAVPDSAYSGGLLYLDRYTITDVARLVNEGSNELAALIKNWKELLEDLD